MKIEILEVAGIGPAIQAMRLPMKSGDKSDSGEKSCPCFKGKKWTGLQKCPWCVSDARYMPDKLACEGLNECYQIGKKDYELSMKLCAAGSDHRKHIRQIDVWAEIQAPLYWWKEFDTYRIGVEKVSESTMHTLMKKPLTPEDFELNKRAKQVLTFQDPETYEHSSVLDTLEALRKEGDFETLNALLPQSYLQKRICKISYEALRNMYHARKNHKLKEWRAFCDWIKTLPYSELITCEDK